MNRLLLVAYNVCDKSLGTNKMTSKVAYPRVLTLKLKPRLI